MGYSFSTQSGTSLYFEETGSGPPVLALHGIGGGAYFFGGFAKRMQSRNRIITLDNPGTGNSISAVTPFTLESSVEDIGDLVREKIGEPVVIVGHSFGTILALKAWEKWPEWIRGLVFTCGLPKVRPNVYKRLSRRAEDIAKNGIAGWGPKMSAEVFSAATFREQPEMAAIFERLFEAQEPASYIRSIEVLLGADVTDIVPTITVPCMAIAGTEDSYAPPEPVKEFVSKIPGGCRQENVQGYGHILILETPETHASMVASFLQSLPRPAGNVSNPAKANGFYGSLP